MCRLVQVMSPTSDHIGHYIMLPQLRKRQGPLTLHMPVEFFIDLRV